MISYTQLATAYATPLRATAATVVISQPTLLYMVVRALNSEVSFTLGNGSVGTGTPRALHKGSQPSETFQITSLSASTLRLTYMNATCESLPHPLLMHASMSQCANLVDVSQIRSLGLLTVQCASHQTALQLWELSNLINHQSVPPVGHPPVSPGTFIQAKSEIQPIQKWEMCDRAMS